MKESLLIKLETLADRYEELAALMSDAEIITDQNKFRQFSMEYSEIEPIVLHFREYKKLQEDLEAAKELLAENDPELNELAKEDCKQCEERLTNLEAELQKALIPQDPNDKRNIFLEVRAGTGGDEAAIFAGDLLRMYMRYAEQQGWRCETMNENAGEHGGYKEAIIKISGQAVYSRLKFESGAHRVQRVPATESQGRVHTSACTVAVMPEVEEVDDIDINPNDLRIDTFRASGAGGQHVNRTDSAIRITHLPTGTVVECQDERSQHKNKARAMSLLQARILQAEQDKQRKEIAETRRSLVGSGDRSERIRTYNYPQGRVTDHRINLTLYKLDEVLEGDLGAVIDPLIQEHQMDQLSALSGGDD